MKTQGTRHKGQDTRDKTQGTSHKGQDTRHKPQGTRHKAQDTRHKTIGIKLKRREDDVSCDSPPLTGTRSYTLISLEIPFIWSRIRHLHDESGINITNASYFNARVRSTIGEFVLFSTP